MWSNCISIGKEYQKEIDFVMRRLPKIKNLSYAVEESKDRLWIYLASACELCQQVEDDIFEMLDIVFLSYMKLRTFVHALNIPICKVSHSRCVLICSLVHFDIEFEKNILHKVLSSSLDFNIDGLFNFRLRTLKDGWQELCEVANRLLDGSQSDEELFDIASFITGGDSKNSKILLRKGKICNLTTNEEVEIERLFDEDEMNLINSIIKQKPSEIVLDDDELSQNFKRAIQHIAYVREN